MFDFITKTAAGAALALGLWAAPADAARIDLADRLLRATPLMSFTDVGATGIELFPGSPPLTVVFFDDDPTAPSILGAAVDIFGAFGPPVLDFEVDTPALSGLITLSFGEIGVDPGGTLIDLLLDVTGGTGDFAGLVGQQLFATVEGPIALFASDLELTGFADTDLLGEGFDVTFSTLAPIPLPAGGLLLLGGLGGLALLRRRRHRG